MGDRNYWTEFIGHSVKLTDDQLADNIAALRDKLQMPPSIPSGTTCFKLNFGGYEITVIKNDMMPPDGYAVLSPELYEKLYNYFSKLGV